MFNKILPQEGRTDRWDGFTNSVCFFNSSLDEIELVEFWLGTTITMDITETFQENVI